MLSCDWQAANESRVPVATRVKRFIKGRFCVVNLGKKVVVEGMNKMNRKEGSKFGCKERPLGGITIKRQKH